MNRKRRPPRDWTADMDGLSNSSADYRAIAAQVAALIRDSAFDLVRGNSERVGRLIVSQLAHGPYKMAPSAALKASRP